ncbi:hypothetical protein ACLOJK_011086 [Asimina triloba]
MNGSDTTQIHATKRDKKPSRADEARSEPSILLEPHRIGDDEARSGSEDLNRAISHGRDVMKRSPAAAPFLGSCRLARDVALFLPRA